MATQVEGDDDLPSALLLRRERSDMTARTGLRIITRRGHPVVGAALVRYARWLRREYAFPVRVPVYLSPNPHLVTMYGETVSASFFGPYDRWVEPYARIATGDFEAERAARGRNDALAGYLVSLTHELIHYWQWIHGAPFTEEGVGEEAEWIVYQHSQTVEEP